MEQIPNITTLRTICQATAPNPARESFTGKFSRRFSIYTTWLLLHTNITPNQITFLSVIIFFLGTACFFKLTFWWNLIGSLIIFFSIILDGSDGEVARFRKTAGLAGTNYVEPVSHDIQYGFMFPLLGLALYWHGYPWWYLVLGAVASLTKLQYRFLEIRFWLLQNAKETITDEKIKQIKDTFSLFPWWKKLFYWINKNFFSSTGVFLLIFICTLFGRLDVYVWIFAVAYTVLWGMLFTKQVVKIWMKIF